jgi:Raf kinase inhibitor-like YbhB/YbcL family protein
METIAQVEGARMKSGRFFMLFLSLGWSLILMGCGPVTANGTEEEGPPMTIKLTSAAFSEGETIPRKFTCDGEDTSPALAWSDIPEGTKSLALIVDDPDAPGSTFAHWVLYEISANLIGLPEGTKGEGIEGVNDFRRRGYSGPCPPRGSNHRYFFKIYALDSNLSLAAGSSKPEIERAMQGHVLAQGQLTGRYAR